MSRPYPFMSINELDKLFDESTINNLQKFAKKVENAFCAPDEDSHLTKKVSASHSYDIIRLDNEYNIQIDIPGVDKSEISVSVLEPTDGENTKTCIKISDERMKRTGGVYMVAKRLYGKFETLVCLPSDSDTSQNIDAKYTDGVLYVTVKRKNETSKNEGRKVPIS